MSQPTYKIIRIVGVSEECVCAAVSNAVVRAAETLKGLDWFEVAEIRGTIKNGKVDCIQVVMNVGFQVMRPEELTMD